MLNLVILDYKNRLDVIAIKKNSPKLHSSSFGHFSAWQDGGPTVHPAKSKHQLGQASNPGGSPKDQ